MKLRLNLENAANTPANHRVCRVGSQRCFPSARGCVLTSTGDAGNKKRRGIALAGLFEGEAALRKRFTNLEKTEWRKQRGERRGGVLNPRIPSPTAATCTICAKKKTKCENGCARCGVIGMLCVFEEDEAPPDTADGAKRKRRKF